MSPLRQSLAAFLQIQKVQKKLAHIGSAVKDVGRGAPEITNSPPGLLAAQMLRAQPESPIELSCVYHPSDVPYRPRGPRQNLMSLCGHLLFFHINR